MCRYCSSIFLHPKKEKQCCPSEICQKRHEEAVSLRRAERARLASSGLGSGQAKSQFRPSRSDSLPDDALTRSSCRQLACQVLLVALADAVAFARGTGTCSDAVAFFKANHEGSIFAFWCGAAGFDRQWVHEQAMRRIKSKRLLHFEEVANNVG